MGLCSEKEGELGTKSDVVAASRKASTMAKDQHNKLANELATAVMRRYDGDKSKGITLSESIDLLDECVKAAIDMVDSMLPEQLRKTEGPKLKERLLKDIGTKEEMFNKIDNNGDGKLDKNELAEYFLTIFTNAAALHE